MRKLFLAVVILLAILAPFPTGAGAQEEIRVVSSTARVDFPDSLTFSLVVESDSPIEKVVLRYGAEKIGCASAVSEARPDFTPGTRVETRWTWQMKKSGGLPPGAMVEYRWIMESASGSRVITPATTLEFADPKPWVGKTEGKVTIFWYRGDDVFASRLMKAAQEALGKLAEDTGAELTRPVRIFVYGSNEELRGGRIFAQEWEGAVAFTSYAIIAAGISPGRVAWGETTVAHELAHQVVYQVTFNCYNDLPTWLNEGLATYAEGSLGPGMAGQLQRAVSGNNLHSVRTLSSSFSANPAQATLSYAESYSLVDFLIRDSGRQKLLELLLIFKEGSTYDEALERVYGFDTDGLDARWRADQGVPPRPRPTPAPTPAPARAATPAPPTALPPALVPVPSSPIPAPTLAPAPTPAPVTPVASPGCLAPFQTSATSVGGLWVFLVGAMVMGLAVACRTKRDS